MRWIVPLFALSACSTALPNDQDQNHESTFQAGLQVTGAVGVETSQRVSISAPILPNMLVWQYKGGGGYPASDADAHALVEDETYAFEFLLSECAALDPSIVIPAAGASLSSAQLHTNYDRVARCAYERFGAKPYWMPQILDDVDVCGAKLGADWHLLAESDLALLTEPDYQAITTTLAIKASTDGDSFPRQFYFSLDVYVRTAAGTLALANLAPNTQHIQPLPIADSALTELYIGDGRPIGVRCVHTQPIPAAQ